MFLISSSGPLEMTASPLLKGLVRLKQKDKLPPPADHEDLIRFFSAMVLKYRYINFVAYT